MGRRCCSCRACKCAVSRRAGSIRTQPQVTPNPAFNPDRPTVTWLGSLRAARSGGGLTLRWRFRALNGGNRPFQRAELNRRPASGFNFLGGLGAPLTRSGQALAVRYCSSFVSFVSFVVQEFVFHNCARMRLTGAGIAAPRASSRESHITPGSAASGTSADTRRRNGRMSSLK
jgi:hypothetical protein